MENIEKEIKSIDGYTDGVTITFSFDFPKGKNKNRALPISQALFSYEDLIVICQNIGIDFIRNSNKVLIKNELISIRGELKQESDKVIYPLPY